MEMSPAELCRCPCWEGWWRVRAEETQEEEGKRDVAESRLLALMIQCLSASQRPQGAQLWEQNSTERWWPEPSLVGFENPGRSLSLGGSGLESLRTDDQYTSHIGVYLKRRGKIYCVSSSGTPTDAQGKESPLGTLNILFTLMHTQTIAMKFTSFCWCCLKLFWTKWKFLSLFSLV